MTRQHIFDAPISSEIPPDSEPNVATSDSPLQGLRVAFVGRLGGVNRKQARIIVRRLGGVMADQLVPGVDLVVVGADVDPLEVPDVLEDGPVAEAIGSQKMRVVSETEFWQEIGVVEPEANVQQLYTPAMLANLLGVPIATVRRWHRRGLITPTRQIKKLPYFDFQEVASAKRIAALIASGANPKAIESRLSGLADLFPNLHRPLAQLSILVEGSRVLLRQGAGLIEPGGQMRIDFAAHDQARLPEASGQPDAQETFSFVDHAIVTAHGHPPDEEDDPCWQWLKQGVALEDEGEFDAAIEVYRSCCLANGPTPELCFRMAELLYHENQLGAARERYFVAVEMAPDFVEARANLGCVLVELGQVELAKSAFEGALEHHRDYPDVHFHLARLLDELGTPREAEVHWARFLELSPESAWATEARDRLTQE